MNTRKTKTNLNGFQVAVDKLCHAYDIALSDVYVTGKHAELFHGHRTLAEGVCISLPVNKFLSVRDAAGYSAATLEFENHGVTVHQWPEGKNSMFMSVDGYSVETELQLLIDQVRSGVLFPSVIGKRLKAARDKMASIDGNHTAKRIYYAGILRDCAPESNEATLLISQWYHAVFNKNIKGVSALVQLVKEFDTPRVVEPMEAPPALREEIVHVADNRPHRNPTVNLGIRPNRQVPGEQRGGDPIEELADGLISFVKAVNASLGHIPGFDLYPPSVLGVMFSQHKGWFDSEALRRMSMAKSIELAAAFAGCDIRSSSLTNETFEDMLHDFIDGLDYGNQCSSRVHDDDVRGYHARNEQRGEHHNCDRSGIDQEFMDRTYDRERRDSRNANYGIGFDRGYVDREARRTRLREYNGRRPSRLSR